MSLGATDINIHEARGLAAVGVFLLGAAAAAVFVIALVASLAETLSR